MERCNGIDDNCDGRTDEDVPVGAQCNEGVSECLERLDNDYDGSADEGLNVGQPCTAGIGACLRGGQIICNGGGNAICTASPGQPIQERCKFVDDSCDDRLDERCDNF